MNTNRVVGLWRMSKRFDCVISDDMQVIQVEQNLWQCLLQKNRLFSFTTSSWCTRSKQHLEVKR